MKNTKDYAVRATHCSHEASLDEIYHKLKEITAPLSRSWRKIERAKRVGIKVNMQFRTQSIRYIGGRRQELVDEDVLRASLRLLRERTDAELFALDTSTAPPGQRPGEDFNTKPILDEYGVHYVEAGDPPLERYKVPGGGLMFSEYQLSAELGEADAFVSIAKMKNHGFVGITLCLKNLFGLPPIPPHGRLRTYFHHVIRLSYVLPDLGMIAQPCLNIIDGLTGQARMEWNGEGRIADCLVAGDHVIATDACGSHLMGTDPALDWPHPPFRRDRSPVAVAAEHGFGTTNLNEIDFAIDGLVLPVAEFDSAQTDPPDIIDQLRRTASEQAFFYRENRDKLLNAHAGQYVFLQDGEVIWSGTDPQQAGSVQEIAARKENQAVWLKLADPDEREGEHMEVYEKILAA